MNKPPHPLLDDRLFDRVTNMTAVEMDIPHDVAKIWVLLFSSVTIDWLMSQNEKTDLRHYMMAHSIAGVLGQLGKVLGLTETKTLAISTLVRATLDREITAAYHRYMRDYPK